MSVKVRLARGLAGKSKRIKDTAYSLGLTRTGKVRVFDKLDKPTFGKLRVLKDFVEIEILGQEKS